MSQLSVTQLSVPEMTCGHCKASVESRLAALPDAGTVTVDLTTRQVVLNGQASAESAVKALAEIGFSATVLTSN